MLEYGKEYKYRELCKALDVEPKRGGYLRSHIEQLSRKYEITKTVDNTYVVERKYDPIEQLEYIKLGKHRAYIESMLYALLASSPSNVIRCDMKDLLQILALVNKDYHFAKWHINEVEEVLLNERSGDLKSFIETTEQMYKSIIKRVLNDMECNKLIKVNQILMFARQYVVEGGRLYTKVSEADKETEIPIFLELERQASMNFITYGSGLSYGQRIAVKKSVEKQLKKRLDVDYYYYSYEIILNKKGLNEVISHNYSELRSSFNQYIQLKTKESKTKNLLLMDNHNKDVYISSLIDINTDLGLRYGV